MPKRVFIPVLQTTARQVPAITLVPANNKLLAEESYRVGIGTILDVNTAATNLNNILISKSNVIYDFILAQKQLEYFQGMLKY